MRFGLMQTKVGIVSILSKYSVRPSEMTPRSLVFSKHSLVLSTEGKLWLNLVDRQARPY
jgi:cytochrome P450 family 6